MRIPSRQTLGIIALVTGIPAFGVLVLPYMLFPQWYIPKANAATGYTAPATIEGWIFMIAGLALLAVTIVCAMLRKNTNQ
jgi:hypothetical protein